MPGSDRTQRTTVTNLRTVVDPKMSLSLWLRAGRAAKGLSLEDVAKITKIQSRILERLEAGKLEGLPAEVFVRGFVRSYARCCGLDEGEALERYAQAAGQPQAPSAAVTRANALVESMSELAPVSASRSPRVLTDVQLAAGSLTEVPRSGSGDTVVEVFLPMNGTLIDEQSVVAPVVAPIETAPVVVEEPVVVAEPVVDVATAVEPVEETGKKKRGRRGGKGRKGKQMASGTPSSPMPIVAEPIIASPDIPAPIVAEGSTTTAVIEELPISLDTTAEAAPLVEESTTTETWSPKMPTVVTPSVPWRRPTSTLMSTAPVVPTLVIDDADPDSAERELEDRHAAKERPSKVMGRSFLPPILLDREDRSARQGGLTLAVIILLIAATLTLSYLMRRPSSTGDGVTMIDGTSQIIGVG